MKRGVKTILSVIQKVFGWFNKQDSYPNLQAAKGSKQEVDDL